MNDKMKAFANNMFKVGTFECAVFCGTVALVVAVLILLFGFWETVLVALLLAVGLFVGGVKDKKNFLRSLINKLFPPRHVKPYKAEDVRITKEENNETPDQEA